MATFRENFANALFGTPTVDYGAENKAYIEELAKQQAFQDLAQRNNLTTQQALGGVMQGLNYGDKGIALRQQELGINTPKNEEQIALAREGMLNDYTTRKGGVLNDLATGFNENLTQAYNPQNLQPRDKNLATIIGEGLGTVARTYNKPVGRGLLAGAAALALGGGGADALTYGLATGVGRQNIEAADKVYRKQLKQMGMSEDDINSIGGMITGDVYKNVADSYKARWNKASWADLAAVNPIVRQAVEANPELANSYLPASVAKEIIRGELTDAQIANLLAKTEKIKAETKQVGKPKVTVNIKKGGTNSTVTHVGGNGGSDDKPTSTGGRPRVHKTNAF